MCVFSRKAGIVVKPKAHVFLRKQKLSHLVLNIFKIVGELTVTLASWGFSRDGDMPARTHRAGQRPDVGSGGEVHRLAGRRPQPEGVADGGLADGGQHHQTL